MSNCPFCGRKIANHRGHKNAFHKACAERHAAEVLAECKHETVAVAWTSRDDVGPAFCDDCGTEVKVAAGEETDR